MTTKPDDPKETEEESTPEEEQSMATMTPERVAKRLEERRSQKEAEGNALLVQAKETAKKAKEAVAEAESYDAGLKMMRDVQLSAVGKELGENAEMDSRLTSFKGNYDRWDESMKKKCSWEEVQRRLLKDSGRQLELARAMEQGGILFGVDGAGNPLVADGGDEPILTNMNYPDTRERVMFRKNEEGKRVPTGYEMFPYKGNDAKSPEILAFEKFTGKPFVVSPDRKEWRSSWLESGDTPSLPRYVYFNPRYPGASSMFNPADPRYWGPNLGVRRLLRVRA